MTGCRSVNVDMFPPNESVLLRKTLAPDANTCLLLSAFCLWHQRRPRGLGEVSLFPSTLLLGTGLLLWSPRLYLPSVLVKPLTVVAAASFSIYLFHTLPFYAWLSDVDWSAPWRAPLYIVMGLAAGLGAHGMLQRVGVRWRHLLAALLPRWQRS